MQAVNNTQTATAEPGDLDDIVATELAEKAGIDAEAADPNLIHIERPFDPDKIRVSTERKTIDLILRRIRRNEIDLAPEFQRRARVWRVARKSQLIESLLLRIPLPVFYVSADTKDDWAVVDGLQRLTTILDFVEGRFPLDGLEYLEAYEGQMFQALPRAMQRRIEETELVINVIQPGTPEEVMINIFKRINTGGVPLNGQEIRNALNKGPVRKFLSELASSDEFRSATAYSVSDQRMDAQECVLRFLAFRMTPWNDYRENDLDSFLNDAMKRINVMHEEERAGLRSEFLRVMRACAAIFGDDAFRKRKRAEDNRRPISKALFEVWSVNLAARTDIELQKLISAKQKVQNEFMRLMNIDYEFDVSISLSTGVPQRVKKRFRSIETLILSTLGTVP